METVEEGIQGFRDSKAFRYGRTTGEAVAQNRNSILHGENISYANPIDAHKAVSWIQYVSSFRTDSWLLKKGRSQT